MLITVLYYGFGAQYLWDHGVNIFSDAAQVPEKQGLTELTGKGR
jgi:hypothetical protein